MIDFSKVGSGSSVDTVLPPREIFNALPKKDARKFQYPRDVQSQVWSKWFERRTEKSLVLKMNTGSGKTVVGLLILKSCLNENMGPAVYVCPDKYLVNQVIDAAGELGVEVTDDVHSHRFLSGKAILVINIYKLVNGMSVFGVGDEGTKIKISSIIVDDAHACLDTIEDQFTINIPAESPAYSEIYELVRDSLHGECESKALEIEAGDATSCLQVPYWTWQKKNTEICNVLIKYRHSDDLRFVWPLVKENPKLSHCVINSKGVEISPHAIPIHMIPSIGDARRRIFMTATLVDDSILASHFGVNEENLNTPIVPDSAGDVGDRMILLPQVINPDTTDDEIKAFCKEISRRINVVVIVPSAYRAEYWGDVSDITLTASNLYYGVDKLKSGHVGLAVLVNKYDGVDLPASACRLLVIDGFPDVRRMVDKVKQSVLTGSNQQANQIVQKIEQGMGRGVRSNDDFCVVFLISKNLTGQLYSQGAKEKFSPGTKAQLGLSEQVSEQLVGRPVSDLEETINYCLERNEEWVRTSKGVLASLTYSECIAIDDVTVSFRNAYDLATKNNFVEAAEILQELTDEIDSDIEKGYVKQVYAEYTNLYDQVEAQKLQKSAVNDNHRVLKPIGGIQYHKIIGGVFDQAAACRKYLTQHFTDPNILIIEVDSILDDLQFKENSSNKFEEAFKRVAKFIGFDSQRPEQEYGKGPDVLWVVGNLEYFVIEAKNEATASLISKGYCNQLNGSCNWFESGYDTTCKYEPILIHPSRVFEYAASPNQKTRIISKEGLAKFRDSVRDFIKVIATNNELDNQAEILKKLIAYRLRAIDIVEVCTTDYKVKN